MKRALLIVSILLFVFTAAGCNIGDLLGADNVSVKVTNSTDAIITVEYQSLYGRDDYNLSRGSSVTLTVVSDSTMRIYKSGGVYASYSIGSSNRTLVID